MKISDDAGPAEPPRVVRRGRHRAARLGWLLALGACRQPAAPAADALQATAQRLAAGTVPWEELKPRVMARLTTAAPPDGRLGQPGPAGLWVGYGVHAGADWLALETAWLDRLGVAREQVLAAAKANLLARFQGKPLARRAAASGTAVLELSDPDGLAAGMLLTKAFWNMVGAQLGGGEPWVVVRDPGHVFVVAAEVPPGAALRQAVQELGGATPLGGPALRWDQGGRIVAVDALTDRR